VDFLQQTAALHINRIMTALLYGLPVTIAGGFY